MKDLGVKEGKKGERDKDSADDTESEDEGARTTTEAPKESGTVRYDPEPNTQQVTSDEHSYAGERKESLNKVRKEHPTENNEKRMKIKYKSLKARIRVMRQ